MLVTPDIAPPEKIDRETLMRLATLDPKKFVAALSFDIAAIAAAIWLNEAYFFNPFVYVLCVFIIGARLHALAVLFHDVTHYRAFNSRNLNTILGEFLGWLFLATLEGYRNNHLAHHKGLNTSADPDWIRKLHDENYDYPKTKLELAWRLLRQVIGIGFIELLMSIIKVKEMRDVSRRTNIQRAGFYVSLLAICAYFNVLDRLIMYWLVPLVTSYTLFFYVRSVAEHHGNIPYEHTYSHSRTLLPANAFESFFFYPHNVGYHMEHHLYPHIPFYNLPELRAALLQQPVFAEKNYTTHGIFNGLFKEMTQGRKGDYLYTLKNAPAAESL